MTGDAHNFYLATLLQTFQYMRITIELIPQEFIDLYRLQDEIKMVFYIAKSRVACMGYQNQAF